MTMRRVHIAARSAALAVLVCPLTSYAADLRFLEPGGGRVSGEHDPAGRSTTAMKWPIYPQARRFDIYGNALGGFFVAVPDPLMVDNGCPKAIEPTYDVDGNLAGYAPFIACR